MPKKKYKAHSANVRDYPEWMSGYEKESLAAEAQLREERADKKGAKQAPKRGAKKSV